MNTLLQNFEKYNNSKVTENGANAYSSTLSKVYDLFAFGAAYRSRTEAECIKLFAEAYAENPELALKCLFYIRDCRGGQGERRFFRVCYKWLADYDTNTALRNMHHIAALGRYDDFFCLVNTEIEEKMYDYLARQLADDIKSDYPSLCAKWMPSINTSSAATRGLAQKFINYMNISQKTHRKVLSKLRERLNILERLMSQGRFSEIDFSKIPSKAGLQYRNAFLTNPDTAERYEEFIKNKDTKVNASTLYPYELVRNALQVNCYDNNNTEIMTLDKYWNNQIDYLNGEDCKMMCVVDTSGSMACNSYGGPRPIDVAISLGIYCAERVGGPFKNHYVSFSRKPQLVKIEGDTFVNKVHNIYKNCIIENTDLIKTLEVLRKATKNAEPNDRLDTLVIISDMEIDVATKSYNRDGLYSDMELERQRWIDDGLTMPHLVYWNCNARNNTILESPSNNISFVSGYSPSIFKSVLTGKNGIDLMLETLSSERYSLIK